jgi:large subunit ribosomal protein L32
MAVPKRRHTTTRRDKRRTHYKLNKGKGLVMPVKCKDGSYRMPHCANPTTGEMED